MARRRRRRSSRSKTAWQRRFGAASKACRGLTKGKRKACMRRKLRKRSR